MLVTNPISRTGHHPRMPSKRVNASPKSDAQPQLPDGTDLGAKDEEEAKAKEDKEHEPSASGPASSGGSTAIVPYRAARKGASGSTDIVPAHRAAVREAAEGTVAPYDWIRLRVLL